MSLTIWLTKVLSQRPKGTQNFLLKTSILERMTGPLCDAVTGGEDGRNMLERLEQSNLFVVPLDNKRQWYRYHHLFADLLHHRLRLQQPEEIPALYIRASVWFEAQKQMDEAIQYALLAKDWERAARLVDQIAQILVVTNSETAKLLQLVSVLPESLLSTFILGFAFFMRGLWSLSGSWTLSNPSWPWLKPIYKTHHHFPIFILPVKSPISRLLFGLMPSPDRAIWIRLKRYLYKSLKVSRHCQLLMLHS